MRQIVTSEDYLIIPAESGPLRIFSYCCKEKIENFGIDLSIAHPVEQYMA